MIVVDTGPLVASVNKRDQHHRPCADLLLNHPGPLLVPMLVITEFCQVLESRCGPTIEAAFLDGLRSNDLTLVEPTQGDFERIADLVRRYADLPLGAADASVVAVAERFGVADVATLDHRHFKIVRPRHIHGFTLLPG